MSAMEVVEGVLGDETSQMSVDMEKASDLDSVTPVEDLHRTLHTSRGELGAWTTEDRTMLLVRLLLETGYWDNVLPRHEKQVLLAATTSASTWRHFWDASVIPSGTALSAASASGAQSPTPSNNTRKSAAAAASKPQKPTTRSKRGTTTPRRRGADTESTDTNNSETTTYSSSSSREHVETLHTRLRTMISDLLVDEVIFPHEKHLERIPVDEHIKQEFGLPREPLSLEPYFTIEELKEVRETLGDAMDKNAVIEYTLPPITDMVPGSDTSVPSQSAPATPGSETRKPKRRLPIAKREARNLYTDSKFTRKWERLELIGASTEYREFFQQMDNVLQSLSSKPQAAPFSRPLKDSEAPDYKQMIETPMDFATMARKLENMLYWSKAAFEQDLALIFNNARAYYTTPDSAHVVTNADELDAIAKPLLAALHDADFTPERDTLLDVLSQVIPDAHPPPETNSTIQPEEPFNAQVDAIKRANFFKEDPSITQWRASVKQRLESGGGTSSDASTDTTEDSVTNPDPLFELPKPEFLQPQWRVASSVVYSSLAPDLPTVRAEWMPALNNPSVTLPACATPRLIQMISHRNQVLLQRVKSHTASKGLAPLDPAVERPIPPPESGPGSSNNPNASDEPRINLIEPSIRLVLPPPPSQQQQQTSPGQPSAGTSQPGHTTQGTATLPPPATMQGTHTNAPSPGKAPAASSGSTLPTSAPTAAKGSSSSSNGSANIAPGSGGAPSSAAPGGSHAAGGKNPAKLAASIVKSEASMDLDGINESVTENPPELPIFSEDNMIQHDPLLDDVPFKYDSSNLLNSRLDDFATNELLKQTIAVQLAMAGFQGAHDTALNVLSDVVSAFIERLGFVATTYCSMPGTLESFHTIMDRTLSESFPRGVCSVASFITSETLKSDNCLKLVHPSTVMGWLEASPTLSHCLIPNPNTASSAKSMSLRKPQDPQKAIVEAIMMQLSREDKLDEKKMETGETREFFLQQAPFARRTASNYRYKPLAYVGSTSNVAVGTPQGLHVVVPPSVHSMEAAKAQAVAAAMAAQQQGGAGSAAGGGSGGTGGGGGMHHGAPGIQGPHGRPAGQPPPPHHQGMHMQPGMHSPNVGGMQGMPPGSLPPGAMPPNAQGNPQMMARGYPGGAPTGMPPGHVPHGGGPGPSAAHAAAHAAAQAARMTHGGGAGGGPPAGVPGGPPAGGAPGHHAAGGGGVGVGMPPGAAPKKSGATPGTMSYASPHAPPPHMTANYHSPANMASPRATGPYHQPPMGYVGAGGHHGMPGPNNPPPTGIPGQPPMHSASPTSAAANIPTIKKTASPVPVAKLNSATRPRYASPGMAVDGQAGGHPAAAALSAVPDEPSPRGTSSKRKRPHSAATPVPSASPGSDDGDAAEGEGRRTRSRRGNTATYGDEYYYEEEFDDGEDGEPKRKKRKTPAKSSKR